MECSGFADDNEVFYVASVDMCTLPAIVTLKVSQPYTGFLFAATSYSDIKHQIGNYFISNIHIVIIEFVAVIDMKISFF